MQADAVGESTQRHAHVPASTHGASSDDCSAVNLPSSTLAQDGVTSFSAQHAQHVTAQDSSAQHKFSAADPSMSSPSHRSSHRAFRKRKQPEQSLPPPIQAQPGAIISQLDNIPGAEKSILDGMPQKVTKPDSLASVLSRKKGMRRGLKHLKGSLHWKDQRAAHALCLHQALVQVRLPESLSVSHSVVSVDHTFMCP